MSRRFPVTEVLIEGLLLGGFMVSACAFGALLWSTASPVARLVTDPVARRALMGAAMGLTAIVLIESPWGRRSGAHMNPAVTLAFLRLGRLPRREGLAYVIAHFSGATLAVAGMARLLGPSLTDPPVRYVQTLPGSAGPGWAFVAEVAISAILMLVVLETSQRARLARWTGVAAGTLVALWILVEDPLSGTSMNPARTFGSAAAAGRFEHYWIYATAPLLGMLLAAELHARRRRTPAPGDPPACSKLRHIDGKPCVFCASRATSPSVP